MDSFGREPGSPRGKAPQNVSLSAVVKDGVDFSDLPGQAEEGTKTAVWLELEMRPGISEKDKLELTALINQLVDALPLKGGARSTGGV